MAIINLYFVARRDESRVSIREAGKRYGSLVLLLNTCVCRGLEVLLSEIVEGMKYDVILMGDLNMVFSPNDTVDPSKVTNDEFLESLFNRFELVDTFSYFHPDAVRAFTCWNQLSGARLTNYGSRIDYILASRTLTAKFLIDSQVLQQQQVSRDLMTLRCVVPCTLSNVKFYAGKRSLPSRSHLKKKLLFL